MNKRTVLDEKILNEIRIKEFEGINIGEMLHYLVEVDLSLANVIKQVLQIVRKTIFFTNEFEISGEPQTVFLFSNSYKGRTDLLKTFDKVVGLSENYLRMVGKGTTKVHLCLIVQFLKLLEWNCILKKKISSIGERIYILRQLYDVYIDYLEYQHYVNRNGIKIDKLVVLCDVHAADFFFTQRFNDEGKVTITLQHGVFSSAADSWAFYNSKSDYFFANSQFSVDEANMSGKKNGKIYAVGLPSYINEENRRNKRTLCNQRLGLILDGEVCHDDNCRMLVFMQDFCKKNNKELYIKLHPLSRENEYDNQIDKQFVKGVHGKDMNIIDFAECIDVAVVRNSTSLLEITRKDVPCFIFVSEGQFMDVFQNVMSLRFETEEQLMHLLANIMKPEYREEFEEIKEYFGGGNSIEENYKRVFREIGII